MATQNHPTGRLRIVAGNWRSRLLKIADVPDLRPTPERIRETLFNWLAAEIHGAKCLDLCAGTGALGLEALSRGAASCLFVEQSSEAAAILRENIAVLNAAGTEIVVADARDYLRGARAIFFDVVFLDPPFAYDMLGELCRLLAGKNLLAKNARIYLELAKEAKEPELPAGWRVLKNKTAGHVRYMLVTAEGLTGA